MYFFSNIFKLITTARRQTTMKGIACTIERVEMRININIIGRNEARLSKTIETWRGGGFGVMK